MVTPTGYTALDLVGFTDKGPYSALENYVKNDLVHYSGSIWRCKIDDTTNVTPAENANWTVFVSERSSLVEASIAPIETSPATAAHAQGSQLFYNDTLYKAKTAIAIGDSLVVDTNIEAAPKVTTQLEAKANTADLGTAAAKNSTNAVTSGSADLVTSGGVYASEQDIYKAMGQMGAKNLCNTKEVIAHSNDLLKKSNTLYEFTSGGHTLSLSINDDGSINLSCDGDTGAAGVLIIDFPLQLENGNKYTVNGIADGSDQTYQIYLQNPNGDGTSVGYLISGEKSWVQDDGNYNVGRLRIRTYAKSEFSVTLYPMVRLASDTDNTYQPYAKTNKQLTKETIGLLENVNKLGAKNLLPNNASTTVTNGITFTVNSDGTVRADSGGSESTGAANLDLCTKIPIDYKNNSVIVSGGYGANGQRLIIFLYDSSQTYLRQYEDTTGNGVLLENTSDAKYLTARIAINTGIVVSNKTFYPMIRLASDTDSTYVPYAMTNQELTFFVSRIKGMQLPIIDLGTSYTAELKADISSGKFEKAVVGGRLTINGHKYLLAHPDYWLNTGDTQCTTHHMLVVPESNLVNGKMNSSNDTTGAYIGSGLKSGTNLDETANSALAYVAAIIKADFGAANILTHRELFTNATVDGKSSGWAWYDSDIDLMNEAMVYGCHAWAGEPKYETGIDKTQIKLFAERPDLITTRAHWWLRDVVSGAGFAFVYAYGNASGYDASNSLGVRPAFAIC